MSSGEIGPRIELEELARIIGQATEVKNPLQAKLDQLATLIPQTKFANLLEWSLYCRPTVEGRPNYLKYVPFWHDIYKDDWHWIMLMIARQMGKSTYAATRKGYTMTKRPRANTLYITYEDESLSVFSQEKFRGMWKESPILSQFPKGSTLGSVTQLELLNGSMAWLVTHAHDFHHVEGKSTDDQIWDELQNLNLDRWAKAMEASSFTHGKFVGMGVGGLVDTIHHKWWKETDQREWIPDDQSVYVDSAGKEWPGHGWRKRLQFDKDMPYDALIWGDYLAEVLNGHWSITKPDNSNSKHGYHITQYMAPWIPLSKADAVKLYKLQPDISIEYKLEHYPYSDFQRHVLAQFVAGERKPFPREALEALCDPKRRFLRPSEVDYQLGDLYLGADWGGGKRTVVWLEQVVNEQYPVRVLINAKKVATPNVEQQYQEVADWIDDYSVKQAVVDGGGGIHQAQKLEERYGDRCMRFFYQKRPAEPGPKDSKEEHLWRRENKWVYDKSWLMQRAEDHIKRPAIEGTNKIRRLVLPNLELMGWIIDQFANEETETVSLSGGGTYLRFFNPYEDQNIHPDDALHAQNCCIVAEDLGKTRGGSHVGGGVDRRNDSYTLPDGFGGDSERMF